MPYYITTPIIFALLEKKLPLERMVIMVQKEVAERITAAPGGKDYGALSVAMQYYTEPEIAFIVPPSSFIPRPSVDSAVVVCKNRTVPPVEICDENCFQGGKGSIFAAPQNVKQCAEEHGHYFAAGTGMAEPCGY